MTDCTFDTNYSDYGGGIYNEDSSPGLTGCTFTGNTAINYGGGMYNYANSSPTLTNCTFAGNTAGTDGGGMYNSNSSPVVTNYIFWGDSPQGIYDNTSTPTVTYCDIQGGYAGMGNIDSDPMFVGGGDYHLQAGSPCIDTGDNGVPSIPATDFEGDPRILDGDGNWTEVVDMGADEYFLIAPMGGSDEDTHVSNYDVTFSIGGFPASVDVEVTVVLDNHWTGGEDIPQDPMETIYAQATFTTDGSGRIENEVIWSAPLEEGEYDVVFDVGPDGTYDVPDDMIDDPNHPGFVVVSGSVGGEVYPLDKAALLMPWLCLGLLLPTMSPLR